MKVSIDYFTDTPLVPEEVIKQVKSIHGPSATVKVGPNSSLPHDLILYAIQQMITTEQLRLLYDESEFYNNRIKVLRAATLSKLAELLDDVIIENEQRVNY